MSDIRPAAICEVRPERAAATITDTLAEDNPPAECHKFTTSWRRNPNLPAMEWRRRIIRDYGPKFAALCEKHGIYHTPDEFKRRLLGYASFVKADFTQEVVIDKLEHYDALFQDPEYIEGLKKEEQLLFDHSSMTLGYGFELTFVEEGKKRGWPKCGSR